MKWWRRKINLFMNVEKKIIKHVATLFLGAFGGALLNASEHIKTFFWQHVLFIFSIFMKMHFLSFDDFLHKNFLILSNYVISDCKSFKHHHNTWTLWLFSANRCLKKLLLMNLISNQMLRVWYTWNAGKAPYCA